MKNLGSGSVEEPIAGSYSDSTNLSHGFCSAPSSLENGRKLLIPRGRIFMIRCEPRIMGNLAELS
jgi:hypothetical protein